MEIYENMVHVFQNFGFIPNAREGQFLCLHNTFFFSFVTTAGTSAPNKNTKTDKNKQQKNSKLTKTFHFSFLYSCRKDRRFHPKSHQKTSSSQYGDYPSLQAVIFICSKPSEKNLP